MLSKRMMHLRSVLESSVADVRELVVSLGLSRRVRVACSSFLFGAGAEELILGLLLLC